MTCVTWREAAAGPGNGRSSCLFCGTVGCGGGAPLPAEDPSRMTLRLTSPAFAGRWHDPQDATRATAPTGRRRWNGREFPARPARWP